MEIPRLGFESELQLPAYARAMAIQHPSLICNLGCSLQQCQILNPLSEARNWTHRHCVRFLTCCATRGTPSIISNSALSLAQVSRLGWVGTVPYIFGLPLKASRGSGSSSVMVLASSATTPCIILAQPCLPSLHSSPNVHKQRSCSLDWSSLPLTQ